ncbi:MAG TPA: hypothetical protein VFK27_04345 [Bacillales bacterium]|nr:hypothetical protein [Bacillales bacterium]
MMQFGGAALFTMIPMLYFLLILFIAVLTIVFLFKAIAFMNQKTENDRIRNEGLREIVLHLKKEDEARE